MGALLAKAAAYRGTAAEFRGLRVTPSVYTTLEEVDRFAEVMEGIAERGVVG